MSFVTPIAPTSADTGNPLNLSGHITGNPIQGSATFGADITVGHTVFIIFAALSILWILGAVTFRSVRM